jgi:selenocysteine-specific elongation factor
MHIIGTAGHVDHGKSSLVIALTSHNPDRLIEEQQRGMTLDLGFAPLRFADGVEAGIIDVPGHERFLHNMLAGASGMELLLLVIAANEGPKPQTYEHLEILNFLNVVRAIVVLTKVDLVAAHERSIAAQRARAACQGTVASDAPVLAVSTVTGEGIADLKTAIHDALAALPPRRTSAPVFMPVDRVFALPGHGTIVTGTLMQGTVRIGDTLRLQPSGLPARVKNLQIFGRKASEATAGSRLAVNLPGVGVDQIARGETLVATREFAPTRELVVEFSPVLSALALLRKRVPVRVHIGSAEVPAHLRFADGLPQEARAARAAISMWRPVVAYPGMRIIVRRMSPKDLLGGARVLALGTSSLPSETSQPADVETPGSAQPSEILVALEASGLVPLDAAALAARANVRLEIAQRELAALVEDGRAARLHKPAEYLSQTAYENAFNRVKAMLQRHHRQAPWRLGATSAQVAAELSVSEALAGRLLASWQEDGWVASRTRFWHLPDFAPSFTKEQRDFFAEVLPANSQTPLLPGSFDRVATAARHSKPLAEALETLLATGALVRIGDDLYRRSQILAAQNAVRALLEKNGQATMAQLRDILKTSRKYALPLMEHLDSLGFTIRVGDMRRLRHQG